MTGGDRSRPAGGAEPEAVQAALDVLGSTAVADAALGSTTTYRVGGRAAVGVQVSGAEELALVGEAHRVSGLPLLVVGRGSNLLVADQGFAGIAITLDPRAFSDVEVSGTAVVAGASVPLPTLARRSAEAGLTGLEWAVGVPGSVGGGIRMNAGGHGSQMARSVRLARVVDLSGGRPEVTDRPAADLAFTYRHSGIGPADVVVSATFDLAPGGRDVSLATIHDIVRWRREHQPGGQNAGSVFTNPTGGPDMPSAGWLIDDAGLRGFRHRSATVSAKHANFIQADPGGSADDIAKLIAIVRRRVEEGTGIVLHTEIRMIGFSPSDRQSSDRQSSDPQSSNHQSQPEGEVDR
jgi:UDP-N-acetylmuramate dehydrogenase